MKVKLLVLFGLAVVPLSSIGQTATTKACFYNKGKMSVVGQTPTNTVLYVGGDFIVSRDAVDPAVKSEIFVDKSRTVITGDFIQDASFEDGTNANAFSLPTENANGAVIAFKGGTQYVKTRLGYNSQRKGSNYINFPNIEVDNDSLTINPEIAAKAYNVNLAKGKLILGSRRVVDGDTISNGNGGFTLAGATGAKEYSLLAHLEVNPSATITYNRDVTRPIAELGVIQVNMQLDPAYGQPGSELSKNGRSIVGMGSPFNTIASDYFMWNHLMFPYQTNIIGRLNYTETSPRIVIPAGKGFVTGIDLKGDQRNDYTVGSEWEPGMSGVSPFLQRAKDGYVFNRFAFQNLNNVYPLDKAEFANKNSSSAFVLVSNINNPSQGLDPAVTYEKWVDFYPYKEELVYKDVQVDLIPGYNFLANPFTAPLDLSDLLNQTGSALNPWGVSRGGSDNTTGYDIFDRVWVLNPSSRGSASHNLSTGAAYGPDQERIFVKYSYLLLKKVGGTFNEAVNQGTIAPLQMFLVYANSSATNKKMTIPASKRLITEGSLFFRSASASDVSVDDFLFEVRDLTTNVFDRTAVVVRTPDEIESDPTYSNVGKIITAVSDGKDDPKDVRTADYKTVTTVGELPKATTNSMLYTKDDIGTTLESNVLPASANIAQKTFTLFLSPSQTDQNIEIRLGRLNSKERTQKIWLFDKLKNKKVELSATGVYSTDTRSTDDHDRFEVTLEFRNTSGAEGDFENSTQSIYSYYKNNLLTVAGFEDEDMNSIISVYDVQGRLLNQTKVDRLEVEIPLSVPSGAYIVKVLGKKSYVSKFLVK